MVTYIYFVKCPNCEDEHFDFFDEAKAFAMGCLSQKPVITQTEVNRNDFGECTDHCDLGTVWSWEDVVGKTEEEPTTFSKDDIKADYDPDNDPEFQDDDFFTVNSEELTENVRFSFKNKEDKDEFFKLCHEIGIVTGEDLKKFMDEQNADDGNLLDKLREYRAELGPDFEVKEACERKPVPEGMTIEQLKETMEENEDTVECAGCEELFPKDECFHKEGIGWLCGNCEDRIVRCTWCDELYDKGECRYEVDLGWLCDRCEMAIKSRGETLTFREGNYWDFLDEDYQGSNDIKIIDKPEDGGKWYTISDLAHHNETLKLVCANNEDKVYDVVNEIIADTWLDPEDVYYYESSEEDLEYINELTNGAFKEKAQLNSPKAAPRNITEAVAKDYEPGKDWEFTTTGAYDQDVSYYVPCEYVLDALMELVDDEYIDFSTEGEYKTVKEITDAGKLVELLTDDFSTHVSNYSLELDDYFAEDRDTAVEASDDRNERSFRDEGPGGGAWSSWDSFWHDHGV